MKAVRGSGPIFGVAMLLWGFAQAPFLHIHAADLDHDHNSQPAHLHFQDIPAERGPQLDSHAKDDDAVVVVWNIALPPGIQLSLDLDATDRPLIAAPVLLDAGIPTVRFHSHDPPVLRLRNSRAPPA
jgi:hypothetical protein